MEERRIKKERRNFFKKYALIISILIMASSMYLVHNANLQLQEQIELKDQVAWDNNSLTKQVTLLEDKNKLLQEKCQKQQETIDRLMKLETVTTVKKVAMSETRGGSLENQVAVINTMQDRSNLWGVSVKEAITAPNQYASPFKGEINDSMNTAFELAFLDGYRVFDEPTTHFYSGSEPYWADNKVKRGSVDGHTFMY